MSTKEDKGVEGVSAHMEREIVFYLSYHSNKINQIIHFIFIPQILWSAMILFGHVWFNGYENHDIATGAAWRVTPALIIAAAFQAYYIYLNRFAGITYLPVMAGMYLTSAYLVAHPEGLPLATRFTDHPSALPFALAVHIHGWLWQFFGHFKFEGRAPALTENLVQALVTAPYFVHIELLMHAFGWKPSLQKRLTNMAGLRIAAMNRAKRGGKKTQ